jgi:hypothetical protein
MDQQESVTLTGTNETESFANRLSHLREVMKDLMESVAQDAPFVLPGYLLSTEVAVSYGDNGRNLLVTNDPQQMEPAFWHRPGRRPWEV